jgi:hypothetical protein
LSPKSYLVRRLLCIPVHADSSKVSRMKRECKICHIVADKANSLRISELDVSVVGLNRDQLFRGYTFVAYKGHVMELYHLSLDERTRFCEDQSCESIGRGVSSR